MGSASHQLDDSIRATIMAMLGDGRVHSVICAFKNNDDGAPIAKVTVVYDADRPLTADEMNDVLGAVWPEDAADASPVPVIDFQEDTDIESVAAE